MLVVITAVLLAAAGAALLGVAWFSWQGKLARNRFAGVRTTASMRSDEAFKLANKIAAPGMAAGGVVLMLTSVGVLALPAPWGLAAAVLSGAVVSLVPVGYGAAVGSKAAGRLAIPSASAPACPYSADACAGGGSCGSSKLCGS